MIRKVENKDIREILTILKEVLNVHYELRNDLFIKDSTKYTSKELEEIIKDSSKPVYVYEEDNKVIGYIFCVIKDVNNNNMIKHKELYIDDLCVLKEYRNKGIGKELLEYIKKEAKSLNCYNITLNVWSGNKAENFYKSLGFKEKKKELELIINENN